ncbi:hypothetical protein E8E14_009021 [Neopestalotiopsis sp. 37M]|nr:hypothetical protein E8E14_009021 [Neopestalotiopsis sp. 37M]
MPTIQCQRSNNAEGLRADPYSGQLVPIQKLIVNYTPEINSIDDGIEFLHPDKEYPDGYAPVSHRRIAAVPSQLAERLARIAQDAEATGRSVFAVREYLKRWNDYGVLIDITVDEENQLKESLGLGRAEATNEILCENIQKMPRVFKFWNQMETAVMLESDGVVIGFMSYSGTPLMRLHVQRTETITITLPPAPPSPKVKQRWWQRLGSIHLRSGTTGFGDATGYDLSYSCGYGGGGCGGGGFGGGD